MHYALLLLLLLASDIDAPLRNGISSTCDIPHELEQKLHADPTALKEASTDFGNAVHFAPSSVFFPSSVEEIRTLIRSSYQCSHPFVISAKGNGHSTDGQAMAEHGVVIDMRELRKSRMATGITISDDRSYADVGGEMLWSDVLNSSLSRGVMPVSWTDYLELTVGGTLSNAGISGQTFRFGPQISNVLEMDVVTGKGEVVTCSASKKPELFFSVLGGLGQFGIITRARIPLKPAKQRVLWTRLLYTNFTQFARDQESIIAINGNRKASAVGYMEGQILLDNGTPNEWETSFFPRTILPTIFSLVKSYGVVYCLEIAEPYFSSEAAAARKKMKSVVKGLSPIPGLVSQVDVLYVDFLERVQAQEDEEVSHPWMTLFVPRSRISEFNDGVVKDILLRRNISFGPLLIYPLNKSKWNPRMSAAIPNEEVFYAVSLLFNCMTKDLDAYITQNNDVMTFCADKGIALKRYLHSYSTEEQWIQHFGRKWRTISSRKMEFDPKHILSPGQRIFN